MTLLQKLDRFPPVLCRLSARDGRGLLSTRKLAARSGLKKSRVHELSVLTSWSGVPVGDAQRFAAACGVNLLATKRRRHLLRVRNWASFIANVKPTQRTLLNVLLTKAGAVAKQAA